MCIRDRVWHESLRNGVARRPASDDDLQLMLLRTSKPVRVGRRGVTLKLHGLELDFYTPELVNMRMKEKVYVRYDPEDLSSVRVYDMEDVYKRQRIHRLQKEACVSFLEE